MSFWKKYRKLHIWLAVDLAVLGLYLALRQNRQLMNSFADHVTTPLKAALGRLCALTNLSIMEILYALAAVGAVAYTVWSVIAVVKARGHRGRRVYSALLGAADGILTVYVLFCLMWGVNYWTDSFQDRAGITAQPVTETELEAVTRYFAEQLTAAADSMPRDENGLYAVPKVQILEESTAVYGGVTELYPFLRFRDTGVKAVRCSRLMSIMGFTGAEVLLAAAFFLVGVAKGSAMNACTILVSDNSADRTRGMNLMHSCYACGALLCPFLIAAAARVSTALAVFLLAALGVVLWLVYWKTPMEGKVKDRKAVIDWSFLHSGRFWLLTGLLFCQNAAEQSVTGWMVTYFKGSGIIAGTLAAYTVTVMWGATLAARLLIAFVFPFKSPRKAMVVMAVTCTLFYVLLMRADSQSAAILLLFAFAFAMAGMNPTAVASAGRMTSVTSMGIMLPAASGGAILMPWVIGRVAERTGLAAGMAMNIVPCVGLIIFSVLVERLSEQEYEKS